MSERLRHDRCGCTWAVGGDDHGCQDEDCYCAEHHQEDEPRANATQERLFAGQWPHCQHCEEAAVALAGKKCSDVLAAHDIACWCQSEAEWLTA